MPLIEPRDDWLSGSNSSAFPSVYFDDATHDVTRELKRPPAKKKRTPKSGGDPELIQRGLDAFRRIFRELRLIEAADRNRSGLSGAQVFVLSRIADDPADSLTELANRTMTDRTSVAAVVRRLREDGLVRASASPHDRRRSTIQITRAGLAALRRTAGPPTDYLLDAINFLNQRDRLRLTQSLETLVAAMGLDRERPHPLFDESPATRPRGDKTQRRKR